MNKIVLDENEIPKKWYNINPDLPSPLPEPRNPEGGENIENLPRVFSRGVLEQEMSMERWIKIPREVRDVYKMIGRPTPLFRAKGLEEMLDTPPGYTTRGRTTHPQEATN